MCANALLDMTCSTTCAKLVRRARSLAQLSTGLSATAFLGTTDEDANAELVDMANDTVRDVMAMFPRLSTGSWSITMVAGTRELDLPTDVSLLEVTRLEYAATEGDMAGREITLIPYWESRQLPDSYTNPDYSADFPPFWSIHPNQSSGGKGQASFWWIPSVARALTLWGRKQWTAWTGSNLSDATPPATEVYAPFPDVLLELASAVLAVRLCRRRNGPGALLDGLTVFREQLVSDWTFRLCQTTGQMAGGALGMAGYPQSDKSRVQWDFRPDF